MELTNLEALHHIFHL